MHLRKILWTLLAVLTVAALPADAIGAIVYDNIASPQPGNVPSVGYEATSAAEFGGQIQLGGTARQNPTVTVLLSSWGCQAGHW